MRRNRARSAERLRASIAAGGFSELHARRPPEVELKVSASISVARFPVAPSHPARYSRGRREGVSQQEDPCRKSVSLCGVYGALVRAGAEARTIVHGASRSSASPKPREPPVTRAQRAPGQLLRGLRIRFSGTSHRFRNSPVLASVQRGLSCQAEPSSRYPDRLTASRVQD